MSWVAIAVAGVGLVSTAVSSNSSKSASKKATNAQLAADAANRGEAAAARDQAIKSMSLLALASSRAWLPNTRRRSMPCSRSQGLKAANCARSSERTMAEA